MTPGSTRTLPASPARGAPTLNRILYLTLLAAATPGPVAAQAELPRIDVAIERIDSGRFPEIDVYFRVVDTNGQTGAKQLTDADVQVFVRESPLVGTPCDVSPISNNFDRPDLRPLAMSFSVDRSASVKPVIRKLGQAIDDYATQMVRDSDPAQPDVASLAAFGGMQSVRSIKRLPFTASEPAINDFSRVHYADTEYGTPYYQAVNVAIEEIAVQPYEVRGVIVMSDGKQFFPSNREDLPREIRQYVEPADGLGRLAAALQVPVFPFAFARISVNPETGGFTAAGVKPSALKPLADLSGGSYFIPQNPIPTLPDLPPVDPGRVDDPSALDDEVARQYVMDALSLAKNAAVEQGLSGELPAGLKDLAGKVLSPPATTYLELIDAFRGGAPALQSVDAVVHRDLSSAHVNLQTLREVAVDQVDLDKFYRRQVFDMFMKIRQSLKNLYRVTYRTCNESYDGRPRDLELFVRYPTPINGVDRVLEGSHTAFYLAPGIGAEDVERPVAIPIDAGNPAIQAMSRSLSPRGGAWKTGTGFTARTALWTQNGLDPDAPRQRIGRILEDGSVQVEDTLPAGLIAAEVTSLLDSVQVTPEVSDSPVQLTLRLRFRTPTCVRNQADPTARPLPVLLDETRGRLLWYTVEGDVVRSYQYTARVPNPASTDLNPLPPVDQLLEATVRYTIPPVTQFIEDFTPPTLAILLRTDAAGTGSVEGLEDPPDPDVAAGTARVPRYTLDGHGFDLDPSRRYDRAPLAAPPAGGPMALAGGAGTVEGYFVRQNERVEIQVLSRDNLDRNDDHVYLVSPSPVPPASNQYPPDLVTSAAAQNDAPPFLPRTRFDTIGGPDGTRRKGGVNWRIVEGTEVRDEGSDSVIFRRANVPDGDPIVLEVTSSDQSGNLTGAAPIRIPIRVLPVGVDIQQLLQEREVTP